MENQDLTGDSSSPGPDTGSPQETTLTASSSGFGPTLERPVSRTQSEPHGLAAFDPSSSVGDFIPIRPGSSAALAAVTILPGDSSLERSSATQGILFTLLNLGFLPCYTGDHFSSVFSCSSTGSGKPKCFSSN
jgi:hypothetical protein